MEKIIEGTIGVLPNDIEANIYLWLEHWESSQKVIKKYIKCYIWEQVKNLHGRNTFMSMMIISYSFLNMARQNIVILIKQAILKWKLSEPIKFTLCKQSEIAICPQSAFLIGNSVKVSVSKDTQELKRIATIYWCERCLISNWDTSSNWIWWKMVLVQFAASAITLQDKMWT